MGPMAYQLCLLCEHLGAGKLGLHARDLSCLVTDWWSSLGGQTVSTCTGSIHSDLAVVGEGVPPSYSALRKSSALAHGSPRWALSTFRIQSTLLSESRLGRNSGQQSKPLQSWRFLNVTEVVARGRNVRDRE